MKDFDLSTPAKRLYAKFRTSGLNAQELSRLSGVPASTIHGLAERDNIYLDTANRLCKALGIPLNDIITEKGELNDNLI